MSMKINFDTANNPEKPTLVLAYKDGRKIGGLNARNIKVKGSMMNPNEISFVVHKFLNGKRNDLWDKIVDFKLVWYKEADLWFEIYVDVDETNETIKNVLCKELGYAELSQIKLFNIEINTENDIARDDYVLPTVLYNEEHPEASLLNRVMEKAPHYSISYVDDTIKNIQRTFTFDGISIEDAFGQIEEEIGCLIVPNSNSDADGNVRRNISVYDLESNCNKCGHRGEFTSVCPKCGSNDINEGYGEDTNIFITADELADSIQLTSDKDSIKNCFKLEAGDDLMTATVRNCNPNGSDYIWYITDDVKADMSEELVEKLDSYDELYKMRQNGSYLVNMPVRTPYNNLVRKYKEYNDTLTEIDSVVRGYPALTKAIYDVIDFRVYLESALMPDVSMQNTNAEEQASLLTANNLSPVAVEDVSNISLPTANNVVLAMAKIIVDSRYQVKVNDSAVLEGQVWTGSFTITNYSDEEDTAVSSVISVNINDDYQTFVQQKVNRAVKEKEKDTEDFSINSLFKMEYNAFCNELKRYCLNRLTSFYDACQACIDVLVDQGVADLATWADSDPNLYEELYVPYYNKLIAIGAEVKLRQSEIEDIVGVYDADGNLIQQGMLSLLTYRKETVQKQLDFQNYIGEDLWLEFCTYRREDKYSNSNYISDGLTNSEVFNNALEFIEVAKNEIYKAAKLQHSISSTLRNLLSMKKFRPLVKSFKTGNWLRIMIDDVVYKLRLLEYEIDFDSPDALSVDFSDVLKTASGESDQKSIMSKITSMTSSYDSLQRQASQGSQSSKTINSWFSEGFNATDMKIIGGADNQSQTWDSHGMLFRKYNYITDDYDSVQLKIINSTIAITDDNWKTVKTAIGNFVYRNPKTNELQSAYGINGEVIVGKLLIGEGLGIYNKTGSLTFDEGGLVVTNDVNTVTIDPNNYSIFNIKNKAGNIFSFDEEGDLVIVGNITAKKLTLLGNVDIGSVDRIDGLSDVAISGDYNDLKNIPTFATIATTGSYNDLLDKPILSSVATSGDYRDLENRPSLATVAVTGSYNDLTDVPEAVDIGEKFDNPINNDVAIAGQYLTKSEEGSIWTDVGMTIEENGLFPVSGKAVYDFALNKKQDIGNADKFLYVDAEGNITFINIDELKALLGINESEV